MCAAIMQMVSARYPEVSSFNTVVRTRLMSFIAWTLSCTIADCPSNVWCASLLRTVIRSLCDV
jgi:hypothetical protein